MRPLRLDPWVKKPKAARTFVHGLGVVKASAPSPTCVRLGTSLFVAVLESPEQDHLVEHGNESLHRPKELDWRGYSEWPEDCSGPR